MKALDPDWIRIRIGVQPKMLDPDPDEMRMRMAATLPGSGHAAHVTGPVLERNRRSLFRLHYENTLAGRVTTFRLPRRICIISEVRTAHLVNQPGLLLDTGHKVEARIRTWTFINPSRIYQVCTGANAAAFFKLYQLGQHSF